MGERDGRSAHDPYAICQQPACGHFYYRHLISRGPTRLGVDSPCKVERCTCQVYAPENYDD